MAKGLKGWVEAFRTGKHPGKGELAKHTFSRDDLDQIVANLDAANPIPHRITHEKMYSPFAYAHGVEAKRDGDVLLLRSEKINPAFEKLVKSGALYERSVGIIKNAKGFALDHIAWLGAEPPAVDGLAAVEFGKDKESLSNFSFVDTQTPYSLKKIARKFREFITDQFDLETANKVIPEHDIESIEWAEQRARDEQQKQFAKDNPDNNSIYSKQTGTDMDKFTQADIDAAAETAATKATADAEAKFKKERDDQNATITSERQERLQGDWQAIADKAIEEGRLTPAQAEGLAEFAVALPVGEDAVVEFSRDTGKGKKAEDIKKPLIEFLADFVASLPKQVAMSRDAIDDLDDLDNTDSSAIAEKAVVYQKAQADKGLTISVSEAVQHVTKKDDK